MLHTLTWSAKQFRTHLGVRMLPYTVIYHEDGTPFDVIDVSTIFPDQSNAWTRPMSDIKGHVWHHDGVMFSGRDANFNGHTTDEEFQRLQADYNWAINLNGMRQPGASSWNGLPYHAIGSLENRIYVPRRDVLATHRAHVAGYDPSTGENFNRTRLGFCTMGNYADEIGVDGKKVSALADRPPEVSIKAAQAWFQTVTNLLGEPMTLRPHRYFARFPGQDWKPCPGTWTTDDSWADVVYQPKKEAPAPPPFDAAKAAQHLEAIERGTRALRGMLEEYSG